jgi:hypothetical protein
MKAAGFFSLATSKCPPGSSTAPSPRDPFASDHARAISLCPSTARSIDADQDRARDMLADSSARSGGEDGSQVEADARAGLALQRVHGLKALVALLVLRRQH